MSVLLLIGFCGAVNLIPIWYRTNLNQYFYTKFHSNSWIILNLLTKDEIIQIMQTNVSLYIWFCGRICYSQIEIQIIFIISIQTFELRRLWIFWIKHEIIKTAIVLQIVISNYFCTVQMLFGNVSFERKKFQLKPWNYFETGTQVETVHTL